MHEARGAQVLSALVFQSTREITRVGAYSAFRLLMLCLLLFSAPPPHTCTDTDGYIVNDLDLLVTVAEAGGTGTERRVWGNNPEDAGANAMP